MPIPNAAEIAELYNEMGYNINPDTAQLDAMYGQKKRKHDMVMIIMADADISAVINYFKTMSFCKADDSKYFNLKKIWVQEPVINIFTDSIVEAQLAKVVMLERLMLTAFRNNDEVIRAVNIETSREYGASIWSENINSTQNVAAALNTFIVWINTSSILDAFLLNIINTSITADYAIPESNNLTRIISDGASELSEKFHLFYDGQWKKPVKQEYWTGETDILIANATEKDIMDCVVSAVRAFQAWSTTPLSKRKNVFQYLADRIASTGNYSLADSIIRWANDPSVCETSTFFLKDDTVNLLVRRDPKGVIVVNSDNTEDLFRMVVYACITGNTVIITSSDYFCKTKLKYCDMFSSCQIPPGLVNILTFANLTPALQYMSNLFPISIITTGNVCVEDERICNPNRDLLKFTRTKFVWMSCK
ncbi:uncharacterized protein LOC107267809 isoform X2 [Cephus cinctus]|uniref:Uncharacterized protein LOC107267809 isoform X2 n=1 Tax=Cephus cinctus TaxID=211228 RepID=A0AAJ7FJU7_CEPCN|nr:uncharacterized protein LOC107267809 isoform X2 [Cephus cinctus]